MLADYAEKIDLKFNQPSNKVSNVLEKLLPLTATVSNPLDYTTPIWGQPEKTGPVFNTFFHDNYDAAILVQDYLPPNINELNKFYLYDAKAFIKEAKLKNLPTIICSTVPENNDPDISNFFVSQGVTPMQGLEEALNAINRSYKFYQRHQDFLLGKVKVKKSIKSLGTKSSMLNEMESKSILNKIGLAIPNFLMKKIILSIKQTEEFSLKFPVCLKMLSREVQHKTDIGAIDLNIKNYQELLTSFEKIKKQVEQSKENFSNNFLVEEMQPEPLGELLVGIFMICNLDM